MKDKLELNMYVRTNDGYINKIKKVNQYNILVDGIDLFGEELNIPNNEIIKASHNIIDLIEVGDYVNGFPVIHKENDILKCGLLVQFKENEIKSIVTHEQMEQMAYKVSD